MGMSAIQKGRLLKMKTLFFVVSIAILFSGCQKTEETKTVGWYMKNPDAMESKLKECRSNLGELEGTPNCINADDAYSTLWECEQFPNMEVCNP
jgi:PBP1b-binding outer membrane lipoprotein LpoB